MSPSPQSNASRSPGTLAAALVTACLLAAPAIADRPSESNARAAVDRAVSTWEHARGLDRATDALEKPSRAHAFVAQSTPRDTADVHWQGGYGLPVPDGYVLALLPFGGGLIVGGKFSRIGDIEAHGIAAWDGKAWSEFPGYPGGAVLDLAPCPGGFFAYSGYGVWRWDGAAWHELGSPPESGDGTAMAVLGDQIALSYWEYTAGDRHARVALYDATGWKTLGGAFDQAVYSLAWYAGDLYAGGEFRNVEGTPIALMARWDGAAWKQVGTGMLAPTDGLARVEALAVFKDELVAGGEFHDASVPERFKDFARWNGTRWAPLGPNSPIGWLTRMRPLGTDLYAVGQLTKGLQGQEYGIARWDGSSWHVAEDQLQYYVYDVAQFGGDFYAGGAVDRDGFRPATSLARRRGGVWEPPIQPTAGMNGLLYAFGPYLRDVVTMNGDVFAAGRFQLTTGSNGWRRVTATARWDGSEWRPLGMESWTFTEALGLAEHQGSLYAIGIFQQNGTVESGSLARLTGDRWELLNSDAFANAYCGVSAFGKLIVGGHISGGAFRGIAAWDGTAWQAIGGGITRETTPNASWVVALARHGDDVIAGGKFVEMDGVQCANIAAWNPTSGWRPLGNLNGNVNDLLSMDGVLYACGGFTAADGVPAGGIAQWRDGHWSPVPPPSGFLSSYPWVTSLGSYHGRLVVGGWDIPGNIAMLEPDGTWRGFGSGLNGTVAAFAENGPSLFACGSFSDAGGNPSYGIAEWRDQGNNRRPESPLPRVVAPHMTATPNPSAADVHLQYDLAGPARVRVEIFDVAGHRVDRAFEGDQVTGPQDVIWRPALSHAPPGIYYARLSIGADSRIVSIIRVE